MEVIINVIKFPDRKARGRTKPEEIHPYREAVGDWNALLMAFTFYGAGIVGVIAIVINIFGL